MSDPISFNCPKCGSPISLPDNIIIEQVKCEYCGSWMIVPEEFRDTSQISEEDRNLLDSLPD
jgi:DNA-directed RNA polymerase subunit RPC12/RpoP